MTTRFDADREQLGELLDGEPRYRALLAALDEEVRT